MPEPLSLAFVWHHHQPFYREPGTSECVLPWVRLHAAKDYVDLAARLERYPAIHQTFNFSPALLLQLQEYGTGALHDHWATLAAKPALELTPGEKRTLLTDLFLASLEHMITPHQRYAELWRMRGSPVTEDSLRLFDVHALRDVQVWHTLVWLGPLQRQRDPVVKRLIAKGEGFTEEEKHELLRRQQELVREVVPLHRRLQDAGQIEVTVSPYAHPILPLLCDTAIAATAQPGVTLPAPPFRFPEDAREHVRRAVQYSTDLFGRAPAGMWPSEGAVSPEALAVMAQAGIRWIGTDEEILSRTLGAPLSRDPEGHLQDPGVLYQPYQYQLGAASLAVVFRDHLLSDRIGFVYQHMEPETAARDFMTRLEWIAAQRPTPETRWLVPVILDGENAWEHYPDNGDVFLECLYTQLAKHSGIRAVTVSEYLAAAPPRARLTTIHPGSWIHHDFHIWIGHPEKNQAWRLLREARVAVTQAEQDPSVNTAQREAAREAVYLAEGSDWFWWLGEDNPSPQRGMFDLLFRQHCLAVYRALGQDPPGELYDPIIRGVALQTHFHAPTAWLAPTVDGAITSYFEWYGAGRFEAQAGGAMQQVTSILQGLSFGFGATDFYLRIDADGAVAELIHRGYRLVVAVLEPAVRRIVLTRAHARIACAVWALNHNACGLITSLATAAVGQVAELAVPLSALEAAPGHSLKFFVKLYEQDAEIESCPAETPVTLTVPGPEDWAALWLV